MSEHSKLPWRDPGEHELTGYGDINHVILSDDGKLVASVYANCFSVKAMDELPTLKEAAGNAALIVNSAATISRLTEALEAIADGNAPMPVATKYRADGKPSKLDKCKHERYMDEGCGACISEYARAALTTSRVSDAEKGGRA